MSTGTPADAAEPEPADGTEPQAPWQRLERATVAVSAILLTGAALLAAILTTIAVAGATSLHAALTWVVPAAVLLIAAGAFADYLRWRKTRYRITPTHVEVHKGILFTSRLRLARDRIRTVDVTAHPVLRWFALVRLAIGTGEQGGGGAVASQTIVLNPVTRRSGERLADELLDRLQADVATSGSERLATWRAGWTRYAPLSVLTPILVGIVIGAGFQVSDWFGRGELPVLIVRDLAQRFGWGPVIGIGSGALLVLAAGLAVAFYLELWWRYRLDREPGGMLRVRRGLLTTRSVSLQERRIRGVNLIEPLGVRLVGAARVEAVATGIGSEQDTQAEVSTLLPAAPRGLALQVLERVLGIAADDVPLAAHPAGARTRRLRWAGMVAAALAGCWLALFTLGLPAWLLILTGTLFAPAALAAPFVALDAAANLGHALTDELLASRHGSIRRSTVLLHREGIIGWQLRQSVFQRRLNLASLIAVTAAGRGRYAVVDADTEQVRTLAEQTVADLLEPRAATAPVAERTVGPPEAGGPTGHSKD